jgi:hypothetical protein
MADILLAGEERGAASPRRAGPLAGLAAALAAEGERRVLWLPVWFGGGIALYFGIMAQRIKTKSTTYLPNRGKRAYLSRFR